MGWGEQVGDRPGHPGQTVRRADGARDDIARWWPDFSSSAWPAHENRAIVVLRCAPRNCSKRAEGTSAYQADGEREIAPRATRRQVVVLNGAKRSERPRRLLSSRGEEELKFWTIEACEALRFAQGDMVHVRRQNRDGRWSAHTDPSFLSQTPRRRGGRSGRQIVRTTRIDLPGSSFINDRDRYVRVYGQTARGAEGARDDMARSWPNISSSATSSIHATRPYGTELHISRFGGLALARMRRRSATAPPATRR